MHLPLTIRSPASPLSSQIKLPHPRAKGVCRSSPSHFPLSALCLPIQSKKARLLNTFSGYVLRSPGAGRRWWLVFLLAFCCPRLSVRARGEPAEGPLQDVTPKSIGTLCKNLFANLDFVSIICVLQILFFGVLLCLHFT